MSYVGNMKMLERVVAALKTVPIRDDVDRGGELDELRLREAARAVMAAMKEPAVHAFVQPLDNILWNKWLDEAMHGDR